MKDPQDVSPITVAFEAQTLDAAEFHHADHLRVAFDLLCKYDFIDACTLYAKGIRALSAKAGVPEKFNLTITYAFLSLIAEKLAATPGTDFDTFVSDHPDLMSKDLLLRWYDRARLDTDKARSIFLMPVVA